MAAERVLGVSEVRRQLHRLLASLQQHPEQRYVIAIHGTVVGQLNAPPTITAPGRAARALLRLGHHERRSTPRAARGHISEQHDRYLYLAKRPKR